MARLIALDPVCAELAEAAGLACDQVDDPDSLVLDGVDVVLAAGAEGLHRAQQWRRRGHRFAVVLRTVADDRDPAAREALEPLAVLREATPDALQAAVASVEPGAALPRLTLDGGVVDLAGRRFSSRAGVVALSELQCRILGYLAQRAGRGISREELQVQVWGHRTALNTRSVDMAISRLRKKIEARPEAPTALLTAQRGGYRLVLRDLEPARLPRPTSSFRGRGELLGRLHGRLAAGVLALVLTGPPGVGKSRLALELAHGRGANSVRVDAAEFTSVGSLITATAAALGLAAATEGDAAARSCALARSAAGLRPRLLVLDHVEGLGPQIAPLVAAFGDEAPGWRLVLACHAAPAVRGEIVAVPPLDPDAASQLFLERARAAGGEAADPAELLPLLDGLPLAIELAAARTRALPLTEMTRLLQKRRDLLAKPRGAVDRHASLAVAVAEAAGRAPAELRADLVRLAPLGASFDLLAANALLGEDAALKLVALVEDSLVQREGERWRLLHAIRAWARGQGSSEERGAAADAHLSWAAELAEHNTARARGFGGQQATRTLAAHSADLLAAWRRASDTGAHGPLLRLAQGLDALWIAHGTEAQRRELADRTLDATAGTAWEAAALLLWAQTRFHADRAGCRERLVRARELLAAFPDPSTAARVTWRLATLEGRLSGYAAAWAVHDAAPPIEGADPHARLEYDVFRTQLESLSGRLDDTQAIAALSALVERAVISDDLATGAIAGRFAALRMQHAGDLDGALALRTRLMAWSEHHPDRRVEGTLAVEMGYDLYGRHDFEGALRWFDRALDIIAVAEPVRRYAVLQSRSLVLLHLGRHAEARAALDEFLGGTRLTGSLNDESQALDLMALLHLDRGEFVLAEACARESVRLAEQVGSPWQLALSGVQLADSLRALGRQDEARQAWGTIDADALPRAQASDVLARQLCLGPAPSVLERLEALLPGASFIGGPTWLEISEALRGSSADRVASLERIRTDGLTAQGRVCAAGLLQGWADEP